MNLRNLPQNLGVKIAVLLLIALTPVGLIAVWQTNKVTQITVATAETALINQTINDAREQSQAVQNAFGMAKTLGTAVVALLDNPLACAKIMSTLVDQRGVVSRARFINLNGAVTCTSALDTENSIPISRVQDMIDDPKERVYWSVPSDQSHSSDLSVETPIFSDDQLIGYLSLSLLPDIYAFKNLPQDQKKPDFLLTFNDSGQILTANTSPMEIAPRLPANQTFKDLFGTDAQVFADRSQFGDDFIYTVAPLMSDAVYSMAIWPNDRITLRSERIRRLALVFPLLMVLVSICVAFLAVHRLVIRHVDDLRQKMQRFAEGEREFPTTPEIPAPSEIREIEETFADMAEQITHEEAENENRIHEKNVLLKEVHHRVKNNLQLIVSIINLQMRKLHSQEGKQALKRIQDRVMGLAMVHGKLYETPSLSKVRADALLREIVDKLYVLGETADATIDLTMNLDEVSLYPDQAVPFSLLSAEAVTNALKYIGTPTNDQNMWLSITLDVADDGENIQLIIANSVPAQPNTTTTEEGTGLGTQLISAFVSQLEAQSSITDNGDKYALAISFKKQAFQADT
ncbi:histidine kinase [Amylibacter ulvae]|uniref:histidine kinase n=1 Tax=Paramylibacter ulvae TaxID=1651968 RepID=A0ABQ3CW69_9RHOB|nr:histidine kinase dimerization/phosphoacceptor domain -containing protein [Amylibacter ulvae]GHA44132.1 histidine kinase [Amylibacter ulvae]